MDIYKSIEEVNEQSSTAITIGTFDGVHIGHIELINKLISKANSNNVKSVIVTFDPHPKQVLDLNFDNNIITPTEDRLKIFSEMGVAATLVVPFDKNFSTIKGKEFIENIIVPFLSPIDIIIGHDHHFGNKRSGNVKLLNNIKHRNKFNVTQVPPYSLNGEIVNSTYIRKSIISGSMSRVKKMLGRPFSLKGKVVSGSGRGKLMGFPTANITPKYEHQITPKNGVYFVLIQFHGKYHQGMCNIGLRPTFDSSDKEIIEVHVFDKDDVNLYNLNVQVLFIKYIRDEKKFESEESLIQQLELDKQICLSRKIRSK